MLKDSRQFEGLVQVDRNLSQRFRKGFDNKYCAHAALQRHIHRLKILPQSTTAARVADVLSMDPGIASFSDQYLLRKTFTCSRRAEDLWGWSQSSALA